MLLAYVASHVGVGLWIVHGGGDEVVQVQIFNFERALHVRATLSQQTHDFSLILRGVEGCPEFLRQDEHLAERKQKSEPAMIPSALRPLIRRRYKR